MITGNYEKVIVASSLNRIKQNLCYKGYGYKSVPDYDNEGMICSKNIMN